MARSCRYGVNSFRGEVTSPSVRAQELDVAVLLRHASLDEAAGPGHGLAGVLKHEELLQQFPCICGPVDLGLGINQFYVASRQMPSPRRQLGIRLYLSPTEVPGRVLAEEKLACSPAATSSEVSRRGTISWTEYSLPCT